MGLAGPSLGRELRALALSHTAHRWRGAGVAHRLRSTPLIISRPRLRLRRPFGTAVRQHARKSPLVPALVRASM
jgi:hypothetical protein